MTLRIGSEEHLVCLQHVKAPGPHGESVCLGYEYTYHVVGMPAYVSDEGYVLVVEGSDRYYPLDAAQIAADQQAGLLPTAMPKYSLGAGTYAWGFSLWPMLALCAALTVWIGRRQAARTRRRLAEDAATPVATGGPVLRTDGDRYIQAQVAPQLAAGEAITHQAYGVDRALGGRGALGQLADAYRQKGLFAAWTGTRLFLIETRVGAWKPLLENKGVEVIERARIRAITRTDERSLVIALDDGTTRTIVVDGRTKHFSNQDAFVRDLPRAIAVAPTPATAA
jgi:hypothetical protein